MVIGAALQDVLSVRISAAWSLANVAGTLREALQSPEAGRLHGDAQFHLAQIAQSMPYACKHKPQHA